MLEICFYLEEGEGLLVFARRLFQLKRSYLLQASFIPSISSTPTG